MVQIVPDGTSKVQFYSDLYRSYKRRAYNDLVREARNWAIFSGVNFKQWNPAALAQLISEKRPPHQVNWLQKQINSLAGNFYQNEFEIDFEPNMGAPNNDSLLLKTLYLTDANRGDWQKSRRKLIRGGLVYRGTVEMYVDYKTDPRGSLSTRYINHRRLLFDPDWSTDEIVDNEAIIQFSWMSAPDIKRVYNAKGSEIDSAVALWKQTSNQRSDTGQRERENGLSYYNSEDFVDIINQKYLVIQVSRLDRGYSARLIERASGNRLPEMSEANIESMMALRGTELKVVEDQYAKLKITTIVPGLSKDLVLEDDKMHKIQNGTYQYHTWSAMNIDGEVQGVVDVLADLQEIFNKRESTFTHWQSTVTNGAELYEEDFFASPAEESRYIAEGNKPGTKFKVGSGKLSQSRVGIQVKPRGEVPNDLHLSADRMFSMSPEVGYTTPSFTGGEGKSGESSKLFNSKRAAAMVALEPMTKSLQEYERGLGDAYFYASKPVYGGSPRIVNDFKTKKPIFLNIPTASGEIENDINKIKRHSVIIKTSRNGETTRRELLDRYQEVLQVVSNPINKSLIEKHMISYLPNIPDEEIAAAEKGADLFLKLQISRVNTELMQNQAGMAQFAAQLNQIQQQLGQMAGGPGAAASPLGPLGPSAPGRTPSDGGGISVEGKPKLAGTSVPVDVSAVNQFR